MMGLVSVTSLTQKGNAVGAVLTRLWERRVEMMVLNERVSADHAPKSAPLSDAAPDGFGDFPRQTVAVYHACSPVGN
jgi:hypothetical protein